MTDSPFIDEPSDRFIRPSKRRGRELHDQLAELPRWARELITGLECANYENISHLCAIREAVLKGDDEMVRALTGWIWGPRPPLDDEGRRDEIAKMTLMDIARSKAKADFR